MAATAERRASNEVVTTTHIWACSPRQDSSRHTPHEGLGARSGPYRCQVAHSRAPGRGAQIADAFHLRCSRSEWVMSVRDSPGRRRSRRWGSPLYDAGVRALSGERGRQGTVIGSLVWLCSATISRPGSRTQHVTGGCRPCDASLRRRPLRRRRNRRAAITAMRRMAVGVKNHGQPPEERDHCDDWDDDGSQARSCHVIPSLRSEPAGRDCGSRSPGRPASVLAKGPGPAPVSRQAQCSEPAPVVGMSPDLPR
jgi:hypothetical protein